MAAPFYFDPNARICIILCSFANFQLVHFNDQVSQTWLNLLLAYLLLVPWHLINLYSTLERATLIRFSYIFVYFQPSLQLVIQLVEQIDISRPSKLPRQNPLLELNLKYLLFKLTVCASVYDSIFITNVLPIWQLFIR